MNVNIVREKEYVCVCVYSRICALATPRLHYITFCIVILGGSALIFGYAYIHTYSNKMNNNGNSNSNYYYYYNIIILVVFS